MNRDLTAEKSALRAEMLRRRHAMRFDERAAADAAIAEAVTALPAFQAAKQIFAYVSVAHEVGTQALLEASLAAGKTLGLPVCDTVAHTMTFYRLDALSELRSGAYRIPVPPTDEARVLTPDADTLVLVPMLAIDGEGNRLGAGGGYYDRFLSANAVRTAGLCYACCCLDTLPHEAHDLPVRICITEQSTKEFSHGKR